MLFLETFLNGSAESSGEDTTAIVATVRSRSVLTSTTFYPTPKTRGVPISHIMAYGTPPFLLTRLGWIAVPLISHDRLGRDVHNEGLASPLNFNVTG